MQRLEFCGDAAFNERYRICVNDRPLALRAVSAGTFLAGLRYRRTNLYPSMHPGIPTQLPLSLTIIDRESKRIVEGFEMEKNDATFRRVAKGGSPSLAGRPCRGGRKSDLTYDLRLG
jgi:uncharacterized protein (DUF2126 family)